MYTLSPQELVPVFNSHGISLVWPMQLEEETLRREQYGADLEQFYAIQNVRPSLPPYFGCYLWSSQWGPLLEACLLSPRSGV